MTLENYQKMKKIDIRNIERDEIVDIADIKIDESQSIKKRAHSYIEQVKNPFVQKIGEYILVIGYDDNSEDSIDDKMLKLAKKGMEIIV